MEMMLMLPLALLAIAIPFVLPIVLWVRGVEARREIGRLRERVEELERTLARANLAVAPAPPIRAGGPAMSSPLDVAPDPSVVFGPGLVLPLVGGTAREVVAAQAAADALDALRDPERSPPSPAAAATSHPRDMAGLEQLIGGIWLQNAGSVVLLLGVFLLILWGYTTGRVGPGVLVGAGVALGLAFVWRGDRVARSVRRFGHALIGVGLGIIYLALYLGHFRLGALPTMVAFPGLALVAVLTVWAGLRTREPTIAALGVIGAFLPQLMVAWLPALGFALPPAGLLAYLALIDLIVFALAVTAGWSGLSLTALALTTATWVWAFHGPDWGWGVQLGLAALYLGLGIAPVLRLARSSAPVRSLDFTVVAAAPLCFLAASAPTIAFASARSVALLLGAVAAVHAGVAVWVDARRPQRDLWRPLTGAAVVDLTIALERLLGTQHTALAWTAEGVVLMALGLKERGAWMRLCGSVVTAVGAIWTIGVLTEGMSDGTGPPLIGGLSLHGLAVIAFVLAGGVLLERSRARLAMGERFAPEVWTAAGNLLFMVWGFREASLLSAQLVRPGGPWAREPVVGVSWADRRGAIGLALVHAAWMGQALLLTLVGSLRRRRFLRVGGTCVGALAMFVALVGLSTRDGWGLDLRPVLHPVSLLQLLAVIFAAMGAVGLAERRDTLIGSERRLPEAWALAASFACLLWSTREAGHLAQAIVALTGDPGGAFSQGEFAHLRTLRTTITSAAWVLEAIALLLAGWIRGSAFLRWCALGLLGLTLLKFMLVDLQTVDVFWRFLTAIAVGAAMLAISYVYQARARARVGPPPSPQRDQHP